MCIFMYAAASKLIATRTHVHGQEDACTIAHTGSTPDTHPPPGSEETVHRHRNVKAEYVPCSWCTRKRATSEPSSEPPEL
jgi:hypothetical protein